MVSIRISRGGSILNRMTVKTTARNRTPHILYYMSNHMLGGYTHMSGQKIIASLLNIKQIFEVHTVNCSQFKLVKYFIVIPILVHFRV
jgi:hypothetical protein